MAEQSAQLIQKLWNYCNILRDDGSSYGDYPSALLRTGYEQLTFLLFLKMADEQSRPPFSKPSPIPKDFHGRACSSALIIDIHCWCAEISNQSRVEPSLDQALVQPNRALDTKVRFRLTCAHLGSWWVFKPS